MNTETKYNLRYNIGQLIKRNRIIQKMTQQQLADKLKVDRQYIYKIENGKINLTLDYLEKIIKSLNSPSKDFFKKIK